MIDNTGNAVQDTNNASLFDKSILPRILNKYSGLTFPISKSEAISK